MTLLTLNFEAVHHRENNADSQAYLELHRDKFNRQCWALLKGMLNGTRYSTHGYNKHHTISSLPRRAKDLIDNYGFPVKCEWAAPGTEKEGYKEYFIEEADYPRCLEIIVNHLQTKKTA